MRRVFLAGATLAVLLVLTGSTAQATIISLLHMDGADGSTVFTDEAASTWTASNAAQVSTADFMFGGSSGRFNGGAVGNIALNDFVTHDGPTDLWPGTDPFTIDFWIYPDAPMQNGQYLVGKSHPDGGQGFDIRLLANGQVAAFGVNGWLPGMVSAVGAIVPEEWQHIALVGDGATASLFIDGELQVAAPQSFLAPTANPVRVGFQANYGGYGFAGYMDEVRFDDTAVWTQDFIPPQAPYTLGGQEPAIPEPASLSLLALGALALRRRRRA